MRATQRRFAAILALAASGLAQAGDLPADITRLGGPLLYLPDRLAAYGDGILFQTRGAPDGGLPAAWLSHGTVASTRPLRLPGYPVHTLLGHRADKVFLQTWSPLLGPPRDVVSLDRRTGLVARLRPGAATLSASAESGFFFTQDSGQEPGLYRTDGSRAGTRRIFQGPIYEIVSIGREVVFWSTAPAAAPGYGLYRAGVTVEHLSGFGQLGYFPTVDAFGTPSLSWLGAFGAHAAFWQGAELWVTDGTPAGTRSVHSGPLGPVAAGACGGQLLFFPYGDVPEVWATDGTLEGTRLLSASVGDFANQSFGVADADGVCYFLTGFHDPARLWKTDLTPAATLEVAPVDYSTAGVPVGAVGARGRVFFPKHAELWTSDGTGDGTRRLAGGFPSSPSHLVRAGGRIFFVTVDDPTTSTPLWALDLPSALYLEDAEARERPSGLAFMVFRLRLSRRAEDEVMVGYRTEPGTALDDADYQPTTGVVRFAPGDREKMIRVPIVADRRAEGPERFYLRLLDAAHADVERGLAQGTIRDPGRGSPVPGR